MARYGDDYGRHLTRWHFGVGGPGSEFGGAEGTGYEEMRQDRWRGNRPDFQGGGGRGRGKGYDAEFGGYGGFDEGRSGWAMRPGGDRFSAGGYGGRYGGREEGYEIGDWNRGSESTSRWNRGGQERVRAADLMTDNPEAVTPESTLVDAARKMRDLDVGIIPVIDSLENRRLRGVITDRDIAVRAVAEGRDGKATVAEFMTTDVETCNKNDSVENVMQVMQREQIRRVPITDREGRLVGIIAQADLAVDYGGEGGRSGRRVQETIERISEPAQPERGHMGASGKTPTGTQNAQRQTGRSGQGGASPEGGRSR